MKKQILLFIVTALLFVSCNSRDAENLSEKNKVEILRTERQFADMVAKEGVTKAFLYFAADDAVINRENRLIKGKKEIRTYLENQPFTRIKLKWTPEFVDVAASGDLGYTYGQFYFSAIDTTGQLVSFKGPFHTIWKKQKDDSWRFVWD